jgi:iron complex outermembrane recepter protein
MRSSALAMTATILLPITAYAQHPVQEQILVTATRHAVDGQTAPLTWSGISDESIDLAGQIHINELMQQIPGAWISRGNGQESLTALRSPVLTGAGSCGAFYMAADGISLRAPGFCNVNQLFDANTEQAGRVEVIKGPATALYGSSAMHGVINVLSSPVATTDHSLSVEAGPNDYYRGKYSAGGESGRHGFSVKLNGTTDGGYKDDSGYDQQKMTLRHEYQGDTWQLTSALDMTNLNQETAGFIRGEEAYKDSDLKDTNPNPEAYRDARSLRLYSTASRMLNDSDRLELTTYLRDNEMEFMMHFLPWKPVEENGHSSLGMRANLYSDRGNWQWVHGADLEYTDGWLKETQTEEFSPNQPAGVHYDYQVDAWMAALYSQAEYSLADNWQLHAGARLEYNGYDYNNRDSDGDACAPTAEACRFYRPADRSDSFNDWSLNLGSSYTMADGAVAFARLAQGFRAPQATELYRLQAGQRSADIDAEEIRNLEVGYRGMGGEQLSYSLSVFYMNKRDVIFQDADRQNISGAKTRHYGGEFSAEYQLSPQWQLQGNVSLARHQYDSRINLIGSSGDIKGNDIDTAPRLFGSARLNWDIPGREDTRAQLEWVYMDSYYLEPDNKHEYEGHSLLNLRLQTRFSQHWDASLRLTNLLDEDYAERADFGFGSYRYFVGQPRAAYAELRYSFN